MRLRLTLTTHQTSPVLPANYQYPLSSAIYKIIQQADAAYAAFLHDKGYTLNGKRFKFFTFSDLRVPFNISGDRLLLTGNNASLFVCFHVPEAAENFIKGLFMHQQLEIADKKSKTTFHVQQVELVPQSLKDESGMLTTVLQPLSPLVVGWKNERGHYDYRSPLDADFADCLIHNWLEKCLAVSSQSSPKQGENPNLLFRNIETGSLKEQIKVQVLPCKYPPKQRLIAIKQGTEHETRVRGYTKFAMQITAPKEMIELALNAGLGLYNAQGMGCVRVV